jgi:hypothetical protein
MEHELYRLNLSCFGAGINHEGQEFTGTLRATTVFNGAGASLHFKATGREGEVFHEEASLIGPDHEGKPSLFVLSTNHPFVMPHQLKHQARDLDGERFVFSAGDMTNKAIFREEITLKIFQDGSVEYSYAWGMPGGEFAERSTAKMAPVRNQ